MDVKSRRAEHAEDTRAALLAAARELFTERGYADTPTEEVVSRARVTRGALYHHFGNKEGLFRAVLEEEDAELVRRLIEKGSAGRFEPHQDAWDRLRAGCQAYLDACLDPTFQRIALVEAPAVLGPEAWIEISDRHGIGLLHERLESAMSEGLIDTVPVDALTNLLGAAIRAASLYSARSEDPASMRAEMGVIFDRLLQGLRRAPGS